MGNMSDATEILKRERERQRILQTSKRVVVTSLNQKLANSIAPVYNLQTKSRKVIAMMGDDKDIKGKVVIAEISSNRQSEQTV